MKHAFNNDDEILDALRSGVRARFNAAVEHLYRDSHIRNTVRRQIINQRGEEEDVNDVLNSTLVVFLNSVEKHTYDPARGVITAYLAGVAKKVFFTLRRSELRKRHKHEHIVMAQVLETTTDPELEFDQQHRRAFVHKFLGRLSERCRELLLLKEDGYSMKEIAEQMQYKSADSTKSAHHDCREKLNDLTQRPEVLKELREL
ncbi:MAG: sigma-70 family RNA polymerase sigma factor [Saprospiraceae bacterium]